MITTKIYEKDFRWPYQAWERAEKESAQMRDDSEPHIWEIYNSNNILATIIYSRSCMTIGQKEIALAAFERLLATHDKYYDYSDDHRVWSKGNSEATTIRHMHKVLTDRGFGNDVEELWKKYMRS